MKQILAALLIGLVFGAVVALAWSKQMNRGMMSERACLYVLAK